MSLRIDPTRTGLIRRGLIRALRARLAAVREFTYGRIVSADAFGRGPLALNTTAWGALPGARQLTAFRAWFGELLDLNVFPDNWLDKYVRDAYRRGADRAFTQTRPAPQASPIQAALKDDYRRAVIDSQRGQQQYNLLYEKVYNNLEGLADRLRRDVAAAVATGIGAFDPPKKLMDRVDGAIKAANDNWIPEFANTEVTRAHAAGQLATFGWMGVQELTVLVEWLAQAGACPRCAARAGGLYTIEEAQDLIPFHKSCRCAWGVPGTTR
jgi:hypothetical protein